MMAVAAVASQTEQAAAIDLNFNTTTQTQTNTNPFNFNFGPGVGNSGPINSNNPTGSTGPVVVNYTNVATISPGVTVDARITAQTFGSNHSFVEHIPNYSSVIAGQPTGDASFLYQIAANQTGAGGMTYKIDLFEGGSSFTNAYTAADLRFLVYDVDGESNGNGIIQTEAVRIAKGTGLVGYQVGSTAQALIPTENSLSYLFSGRNINIAETNTDGAAIFYFQNTNSVQFQFEANTQQIVGTGNNPVFSAIDGDLSLIGQNTNTGFGAVVSTASTAVPEPFTIIGSIVGGTAAFRMRKKLKSTSK
jgi:hypothetical protein